MLGDHLLPALSYANPSTPPPPPASLPFLPVPSIYLVSSHTGIITHASSFIWNILLRIFCFSSIITLIHTAPEEGFLDAMNWILSPAHPAGSYVAALTSKVMVFGDRPLGDNWV